MISSSSVGWKWSDEHTRSWWTKSRSVDVDEIDAAQSFYNYNGHGENVQADSPNGGPNQGSAAPIQLDSGYYLIFHSRVHLYTYWGDQEPDRPEGCVKIYCQATLELARFNGQVYVPIGGDEGSDGDYKERNSEGSDWNEYWFHVWEDVTHSQPGAEYRLMIYVIGGWIDAEDVKHPDPEGGETSWAYYKVTS